MALFVPLKSRSQSNKYPLVRVEKKDTVVVMTVKQADAINDRYKKMKSEIDSLQKLASLPKPKLNCDSVTTTFWELANGPTLLYNYKNEIYTLDLSLYKIKLTNRGRVVMKKMTRYQIGRYFEILHGGITNMIDWKQEFREFELPILESNKKLPPYLYKLKQTINIHD